MMTLSNARLLAALVSDATANAAARLAGMDEDGWTTLLADADRDLLSPELARPLATAALAPLVPYDVVVYLERLSCLNGVRNRRIAAQLREIFPAFDGQGLRPLLLKGAAEFAKAGDEQIARAMIDIDLLFPSDQLTGAVAVLERLGYRRVPKLGVGDPHVVGYFGRLGEPALIDLHRHPLVAAHLLPAESLLARAALVPSHGGSVTVPSRSDDFLLAVLHAMVQDQAYKYGTFSVRRLRGIAVRMAALEPEDWSPILLLAEQGQVVAPFALALRLIGLIFGWDFLPTEAREITSRHRARFTEWRLALNARGRLPQKINALVSGIAEAWASYNHRPLEDGSIAIWRMRRLGAGLFRQCRRNAVTSARGILS